MVQPPGNNRPIPPDPLDSLPTKADAAEGTVSLILHAPGRLISWAGTSSAGYLQSKVEKYIFAKVEAYKNENEKYLKDLTGSDRIAEDLKKLCHKYPALFEEIIPSGLRWTVSQEATREQFSEQVVIFLVTAFAKEAKISAPVSEEQFFIRLFEYLKKKVNGYFENADAQPFGTVDKEIFFLPALDLIGDKLPGVISGFACNPLQVLLRDIYISSRTPLRVSLLSPEQESAANHIATIVSAQLIKFLNGEPLSFLLPHVKPFLEKLVKDLAAEAIAASFRNVGAESFREWIYKLLNEPDLIYERVIKPWEAHPGIPSFIRPVLFSWLKEMFPAFMKSEWALRILAAFELEKRALASQCLKEWGLYEEASDWAKLFSKKMNEPLLNELLLHLMERTALTTQKTASFADFKAVCLGKLMNLISEALQEGDLNLQMRRGITPQTFQQISKKIVDELFPCASLLSMRPYGELMNLLYKVFKLARTDSEKKLPDTPLSREVMGALDKVLELNIEIPHDYLSRFLKECLKTQIFWGVRHHLEKNGWDYKSLCLELYAILTAGHDANRLIGEVILKLLPHLNEYSDEIGKVSAHFIPDLAPYIKNLDSDFETFKIDILARLGFAEELLPLIRTYSKRLSRSITIAGPHLQEIAVENLLYHLISNIAKTRVKDKVSFQEFIKIAAFHFQDVVLEAIQQKPRDCAATLIKNFAPSLFHPQIVDRIVPYIVEIQNKIPQFDENATKQSLREVLWDPIFTLNRDPKLHLERKSKVNEEVSLMIGLEPVILKVVDLTKGLIRKLVQHLGKELPIPIIPPICNRLEQGLSTWVLQKAVCFLKKVEEEERRDLGASEELNKDKVLFRAVSKFLKVYKAFGPERKQACKKESWLPLIEELFALLDVEKDLELPFSFEKGLLKHLKSEIIPGFLIEIHEAVFGLIREVDENRKRLNLLFKANNLTLFTKMLGQVWVRDFLPHILKEESEFLGSLLTEFMNKACGLNICDDKARTFFTLTIQLLADENHKISGVDGESAVHSLFNFAGEWTEALLLKFLVQFFGSVKDADHNLRTNGEGTIGYNVMLKALGALCDYYHAVGHIKRDTFEKHAYRIPVDLLKEGLKAKNLLNPGFRPEIPLKREHFRTLASDFLRMGRFGAALMPVPNQLAAESYALLADFIFPSIFVALEMQLLKPETVNTGMESLLDSLYHSVNGHDVKESEIIPVPPQLKGKLGALVKDLLNLFPSVALAPILEINKIKKMSDDQLDQVFMNLFGQGSLFVFINTLVQENLHKIIPGAVVKLNDTVQNGVIIKNIDLEPHPGKKLEVNFTERLPRTRSELLAAGSRIKAKGAKVLIRGTEKKVIKKNLKKFRKKCSASYHSFIDAYCNRGFKKVFEGVGVVGAFIFDKIIVPLLKALFYFPYLAVKALFNAYLKYQSGHALDEAHGAYHEGAILNAIDAVTGALKEARV